METPKIGATAQPELTPDQREALKKLHDATQQFEGVFLGMLFKAMHDTVSKTSLTGKKSSGEEMFSGMLDEQRAQQLAASGALGIGKIMEQQLRAVVLSGAEHESKVPLPRKNGF